jgi:hypothetical protein
LEETSEVAPLEAADFGGAGFIEDLVGAVDVVRQPFLMGKGDAAGVGVSLCCL